MADKMQIEDRKKHQIVSYYELRMLIGFAGVLLPIILFIGGTWFDEEWLPSISDYYYNNPMRNVFVGILFALAFFLFCYRGYEPIDNRLGNFAAACALSVALLPCNHDLEWIANLHFVSAGCLFLTFIIFSLVLFRKKDPDKPISVQKEKRNRFFAICGYVMIVCIIFIFLGNFVLDEIWWSDHKMTFIMETIALWAFGLSWLVKADLMLKSKD